MSDKYRKHRSRSKSRTNDNYHANDNDDYRKKRRKSTDKEKERKSDKKHRSRERSRSRSRKRSRERRRSRSGRDRSRDRDTYKRSNSDRNGSLKSRDKYSRRSRERDRRSREKSPDVYKDKNRERRSRDREKNRRYSSDWKDSFQKDIELINKERENMNFELGNDQSRFQENFAIKSFNIQTPAIPLDKSIYSVRDGKIDITQAINDILYSTQATKNMAALLSQNIDSANSFTHDNSGDSKPKKKKSRWGGTGDDKTFIPGMPTILPSTLDPNQQEAYLVQLQIEEISRKLRTGELGIPQNHEERSPSPEPIYSSDGKRLNTREFRTRKRLEEQRHQLIVRMQCMNPDFKPPADYKPPVIRVSDKVLVPQEQYPDINFVGLLIGPRGNTLKAMEKETGAKIIIRGKGSVKEGKVGRKDGQPLPGEDEPLHAFITANNPEAVKKAVEKVKEVIQQGIEVPQGNNDLRRMQLRELAQLNGTLRETDAIRCANCGATEHKTWLCPDKPNITNNIICTSCGGAGHISKDCRSKRPGEVSTTSDTETKIDEEYLSLMAELGEGPSSPAKPVDPLVQAHISRGYNLFDQKSSTVKPAISSTPASIQPIPSAPSNTIMPSVPPTSMHPNFSSCAAVPPPAIPLPPWNTGSESSTMPPAPPPPPPPPNGPPPNWMPSPQPPPPGETPLAPPGTTGPIPLAPWSGGPPSMNFWNQNTIMPPGTGPVAPPVPPLPPNFLLSQPPPPPPGN